MIPSEIIHTNESGNAVIGKNLEIDGTTKLKGGLKPIAEYRFATGKLKNYGTFEGHEDIKILGLEDDEGNYNCIGLGDFNLTNQQVDSFAITGFDFNNDEILHFTLTNEGTIDAEFYSKAIDSQAKLHTHTITLTAGTNNYVLMYDCSYETTVESIQDLRSIMEIRSSSDSVILPVVNPTVLSTAGLQVTTSICKIGTANVTAVTDKVTSKS